MRLLSFLLALLAFPVTAQERLTAEEFDAYTQGKTFAYGSMGAAYGSEQYLPDRQVRWAFEGEQCQEGAWYEEAGLICFTYDTEPEPQCWSFTRGAGGLIARFENNTAQSELYEVEQSRTPLVCPGPDLGV